MFLPDLTLDWHHQAELWWADLAETQPSTSFSARSVLLPNLPGKSWNWIRRGKSFPGNLYFYQLHLQRCRLRNLSEIWCRNKERAQEHCCTGPLCGSS